MMAGITRGPSVLGALLPGVLAMLFPARSLGFFSALSRARRPGGQGKSAGTSAAPAAPGARRPRKFASVSANVMLTLDA